MSYVPQPQAEFFHNGGEKRARVECIFGDRGCGASYAAAAKILTMLTPIDGSVLCVGRTERHASRVMADKISEVSRATFFNGAVHIRAIGIHDSCEMGSRHNIVWVDCVQQLPIDFFNAVFCMTDHVIVTTTDSANLYLPVAASVSNFSQSRLINFLMGRGQSDQSLGVSLQQAIKQWKDAA